MTSATNAVARRASSSPCGRSQAGPRRVDSRGGMGEVVGHDLDGVHPAALATAAHGRAYEGVAYVERAGGAVEHVGCQPSRRATLGRPGPARGRDVRSGGRSP